MFRISFVHGIKIVMMYPRTSYFTKRTIKFIAILCKVLSDHIKSENAKEKAERSKSLLNDPTQSILFDDEDEHVKTVDLTMLGQSKVDLTRYTASQFNERVRRYSKNFPCEYVNKIITICLLKWIQVIDKHVQYNCGNLIQALLGEFGEIEESLYEHLVSVSILSKSYLLFG